VITTAGGSGSCSLDHDEEKAPGTLTHQLLNQPKPTSRVAPNSVSRGLQKTCQRQNMPLTKIYYLVSDTTKCGAECHLFATQDELQNALSATIAEVLLKHLRRMTTPSMPSLTLARFTKPSVCGAKPSATRSTPTSTDIRNFNFLHGRVPRHPSPPPTTSYPTSSKTQMPATTISAMPPLTSVPR